MTPFLKSLVDGGPGYIAEAGNGGIVVRPLSDDETGLAAFQSIAEQIIEHAGDGFYLHPLPHRSSEYATPYYDRIIIMIG